MKDRIKRIAGMIRREIASILQGAIDDSRLSGVVITKVEIAKDMRLAKVFYEVPDDPDERTEMQKGLRKAGGYIRSELGKRVYMKFLPRLSFREDHDEQRGESVEMIFRRIECEKSDPEEHK